MSCPTCGNMVASNAASCPRCGHVMRATHTSESNLMMLPGAFMGILLFAGIIGAICHALGIW